MIFSNVASGAVTARGIRPVMIVGVLTFGVGIVLLLRLPVDGLYWRDLLPTFLIISIGMGCSFVSLTVGAFVGVPPSEVGLASGLISTTGQFGNAIGVAILGAVATAQTQSVLGSVVPDPVVLLSAQVAGYQVAFAAALSIVLVALLLAVIGIKSKVPQHEGLTATVPELASETIGTTAV